MPFTDSNGVKIFYKLEGDGPSLVLQHGLTGSHEGWIKHTNYVDALKDKYQLILLDSRGHGSARVCIGKGIGCRARAVLGD